MQQRDYVRAAIYGLESVVSAELEKGGQNPNDLAAPGTVRDKLRRFGRPAFSTLRQLRNGWAHGSRPDNRRLQATLEDESLLQDTLKELLSKLSPR